MEGINPNKRDNNYVIRKVDNLVSSKYFMPALATLAVIGAIGTYSLKPSSSNTNKVSTPVEYVQSVSANGGSLEQRVSSLEQIAGTFEKDKTGKDLVYRIDMNFDGRADEVKVTTSKASQVTYNYPNQVSQKATLDLPYTTEEVIMKYFFSDDEQVNATLKTNPQMLDDLAKYSQKLGIWTSSNDSQFTKAYARLHSIVNNKICFIVFLQ